jgi:hypothetical protein
MSTLQRPAPPVEPWRLPGGSATSAGKSAGSAGGGAPPLADAMVAVSGAAASRPTATAASVLERDRSMPIAADAVLTVFRLSMLIRAPRTV